MLWQRLAVRRLKSGERLTEKGIPRCSHRDGSASTTTSLGSGSSESSVVVESTFPPPRSHISVMSVFLLTSLSTQIESSFVIGVPEKEVRVLARLLDILAADQQSSERAYTPRRNPRILLPTAHSFCGVVLT